MDGGDPERLLRVLNIIEQPSHNCYTEGDPPPIVMWATVFHMLPQPPLFPHQNQLKEKLSLFLKRKEMALCVFVSKWGDFNWEDVPEIYRMPNFLLPSNKTVKNKTFVNIRDQLLNTCKWLELGSTVLLQCSPSPEIPRRTLNTTRYIAHTICLPSTLRSIVGQQVIVINGQSPRQQ